MTDSCSFIDLNLFATNNTDVTKIWVEKMHLLRFQMVCLRPNPNLVKFAGENSCKHQLEV